MADFKPYRIVAGTVNADGTPRLGEGFTVRQETIRPLPGTKPIGVPGCYEISFNPPFRQIFGGSVTQIFDNGNTLDNAVINGDITNERVRVRTGGSGGNTDNRRFTFVFYGEA